MAHPFQSPSRALPLPPMPPCADRRGNGKLHVHIPALTWSVEFSNAAERLLGEVAGLGCKLLLLSAQGPRQLLSRDRVSFASYPADLDIPSLACEAIPGRSHVRCGDKAWTRMSAWFSGVCFDISYLWNKAPQTGFRIGSERGPETKLQGSRLPAHKKERIGDDSLLLFSSETRVSLPIQEGTTQQGRVSA